MGPVRVSDLILLNVSTRALIVSGRPLLVAIHDIRSECRLHPATASGPIGYYLVMVGGVLVASSVSGRALVHALE